MYYFVKQDVPGDHGFWAVDAFPTLQSARVWGINRILWGPKDNTVNIITIDETHGEQLIETINS